MYKRCIALLCAVVFAGTHLFYSGAECTNDKSVICSAVSSRISENGIALIKEFEGFLQYAQWDYKQWTIGYGTGVDKDAYPNGITEQEADMLLREVVVVYEKYVQNFLDKYNISVTQNQYDALVSFTYNMGNVWTNTSEVRIRTYLINGIYNYTPQQITDAFKLWCKAGGEVLPGLLRRREREAELFLSDADYSSQENGERWRIKSATGVRLRRESDTSSEITAVIPYGTLITVDEKKECNGFLWGKTSYKNIEGWCVLDYAEHVSGTVETEVVEDEEKYEKWRIVSDNGVNLRYNYGTENQVLDVIPFDTVITVYEQKESGEFIWGRTENNGKVGWCVLNYASKYNEEEVLQGIRIEKLPDKTIYTAGELFDNSGMCIVAHYSSGREEVVEDYGCSGNTTVPGICIIKIDYMGISCDLSVRVNARKGDINGNGIIDSEDCYSLKTCILNSSSEISGDTGDINGDGVINVFDSIYAKKEILSRSR